MLSAYRKWRGVRMVREAGNIAWLHNSRPWSRGYAIQRAGRHLYAVRRETGKIACRARDITRLEPKILADVQTRPVGALAMQAHGEDPKLAALGYTFAGLYDVLPAGGGCLAIRGDGVSMNAATPDDLRYMMLQDYRANAVRGVRLRAHANGGQR